MRKPTLKLFHDPSPRNAVAFIASIFTIAGCASLNEAPASEWTEEDEAAYQQCLHDRMAEAVAWEMIEQACRDEVEDTDAAPTLQ